MRARWIVMLVLVSFFHLPLIFSEYRADPWYGKKDDRVVQKVGYFYYFCDKYGQECYAVYLTEQDYQDLLNTLKQYRGLWVEDAIEIVERSSNLAARVLRDFKEFREINSIKKIISILTGRVR